jgi:hypothetical protein
MTDNKQLMINAIKRYKNWRTSWSKPQVSTEPIAVRYGMQASGRYKKPQ